MRKLLPYYFQYIGLFLAVSGTLFIIANSYYDGFLSIEENLMKSILKLVIFLGLLFLTFSFQKQESEKIANTRAKLMNNALLFGLSFFFLDSLLAVIYDPENPEYKSGYDILMFMLIYYNFIFQHDLWKYGLRKANSE